MWNSMNSYKVLNDRKALEVIFDYMNLETLTNPECSFVSENAPLSQSPTFSREDGTIPASSADFRRKAMRTDWEAIMCVTGTEETDTRRVVLLYNRAERSFLFPRAMRKIAMLAWIFDECREGQIPASWNGKTR